MLHFEGVWAITIASHKLLTLKLVWVFDTHLGSWGADELPRYVSRARPQFGSYKVMKSEVRSTYLEEHD
jgi:hypothetical protein